MAEGTIEHKSIKFCAWNVSEILKKYLVLEIILSLDILRSHTREITKGNSSKLRIDYIYLSHAFENREALQVITLAKFCLESALIMNTNIDFR